MSDKRHFTVVEGKKEHGLFVGRSPSSVPLTETNFNRAMRLRREATGM